MSVYVSSSFVLVGDEAGLSLDHPVIGWDNIVTTTNIATTSDLTGYPRTNLANPATHLKWKAVTTDDYYISVLFNGRTDIDYVGIAKHNFGSAGIAVSLGYNIGSPAVWHEVVAEYIPANDEPILLRFKQPVDSAYIQIKLRSVAGSAPAEAAVVYVGKLLVLPRKIYQGLTPINYGRVARATNGKSESGNFLGRIVTQEFVQTKIPLSLISPDYYRDHIDAFLNACQEVPFFFSWRPQSYPHEVGYCFMTNDPVPVNEAPHGLISIALEMTGVV